MAVSLKGGIDAKNTIHVTGKLFLVCLRIMVNGLEISIFTPECSSNLK